MSDYVDIDLGDGGSSLVLSLEELVRIYRLVEADTESADQISMRVYNKIQRALFERMTLEELEEL